MKNFRTLFMIAGLMCIAGLSATAQTYTAGVDQVDQEQTNWCWAANSECILRYYSTAVSQCEINNYNWSKSSCCNSPGGCNQTNEMQPIQDILSHFGPVHSDLYSGPLSVSQITGILGDERPFIIGVMWNAGGGHVVVGCGYNTNTSKLTVMDPWNGTTTNNYSGGSSIVISGSSGTWKEGLEVTDMPGGSMPVADVATDKSSGCGSLTVQFTDNSQGNPDTWLWDFKDGSTSSLQNPTHTFSAPGNYDVTLTVSNANGSDNQNIPITVGQGVPYPDKTVGPTDNTFGSGANYTGDQALIFDVTKACVLSSVKVYAQGSGNRTIELRDANDKVLQSKTVNIPDGESRVTLDFDLAVGTDYHIGINGTPNLYRNSAGPSYPYTLPGVLSIKSSTATPTELDYYYFFYDWKVREQGCELATGVQDMEDPLLGISSNPGNGVYQVSFSLSSQANTSILVYDLMGRQVFEKNLGTSPAGSQQQTVDMRDVANGNYMLSLRVDGHSYNRMISKMHR